MIQAALAAVLFGFPGCGGGGGSPGGPSTPTPPPPPVRTVVGSGSFSGLPVNNLLFVPFTTSATGALDFTVDWTVPANGIHIYVSGAPCTIAEINASTCNFLTQSPPSTVKPRLLTLTGAAAGNYTLYIGNRGPSDESVSWQIGLTSAFGTAPLRAHGARSQGRWEALVAR